MCFQYLKMTLNKEIDDTYHFSNNPVISQNADVLGSQESNVTVVPTNQGCLKFADPETTGKPS